MDQVDPWQVVPRQIFTLYFHLLISIAFVIVNSVGCLGVTVARQVIRKLRNGLVLNTVQTCKVSVSKPDI